MTKDFSSGPVDRLVENSQATEDRLDNVISSLNDVIWSISLPDFRVSFISSAAQTVYGYALSRFYENPDFWYEIIHPDDLDGVKAQAVTLPKTGMKYVECRIVCADGKIKWINDRAWLVRDADGNPVRIDGITIDITRRHQTEEDLRKLSRAVEQSPASVIITGKTGNIEYVNPKFTELTGFTREDVVGNNPRILKSGLTPPEVYQNLWATITTGEVWSGEILNKKKNGDLFWEYEIISPIKNEKSEITHFVAVKENITQRKQAEGALLDQLQFIRQLLQTIPNPVFYKDEKGRYLGCNHAFEEYIGISRENLVGKTVYDIAPKDLADIYFEADNALFRKPGTQVYDASVKYADGARHDVVFYKATFSKNDGALGGLVGVILDITERRQHERSLKQINRTLTVLSSCNQALVHAADENGLLESICSNLIEIGGYRMAWVGFAERDAPRTARPAMQAGHDGGLLDPATTAPLAGEAEAGPAATAIRTGAPAIIRDISTDPRFAAWRTEALKRGYASCIALPLKSEDQILGALTIYAGEADIFDAREVDLLKELANDLAYGIVSLRAAKKLRLSERAIESSSNGIMITDVSLHDNPIIYVNPSFERITGYGAAEVIGRNGRFLVGNDVDQPELEKTRAALRERREGRALLRNYRKDGTLFWNDLSLAPVRNEQGHVTHYVSIINDVTERVLYEEELQHRACHDPLTGLANRNVLTDRLRQAVLFAHRSQRMVAVLLLDLDHFKMVNDSVGHAAGDSLLIAVAERLSACVREGDTVARLGGDEFVLVLAEVEQPEHTAMAMERIHEAMAAPFLLGEQEFFVSCSIGASLYPKDGSDAGTLLKNADVAMYRAKEHGRNNYQFYVAEMDSRLKTRLSMESGLRRALEREEFVLRYQPQVDLQSGRIVGVEALIAWQHPQLGMIMPGKFIYLAEETGLILPIGEWALTTACRQNKAWQKAGLPPIRMAVNLSARQFRQEKLAESVERILTGTALDPKYLELELTESMVMHNADTATATLHDLKAIGTRISLDDFGTGYSSLSYLNRFPIDNLKVDRSFVRDITTNPQDAAIVTAVIALAHSLKLKVIAEGVETQTQLDYLHAHRCDEIQGYYFSPPVPAEEFPEMLTTGKSLPPAPDAAHTRMPASGVGGDGQTWLPRP